MMRTPCGVFCIPIYLRKYGWVVIGRPASFIDYFVFGVGGEGKFLCFFQVCQSSRVV